jgi:hypothetical protein
VLLVCVVQPVKYRSGNQMQCCAFQALRVGYFRQFLFRGLKGIMTSSSPPQQQHKFVQRPSEGGSLEWVLVDGDYDYLREIGRAAYADMLHDLDRVWVQLTVIT